MDNQSTAIVEQPSQAIQTVDPKAQVAFAQQCADVLMDVINKKAKPVMINGEQYLEFEDWQTIARFYNCTVGIDWTKPLVSDAGVNGASRFVGYEARALVFDKTGRQLSAAEANCTVSEKKWKERDRFQIKSMAQTRACSKALRNVFSWVVALKGLRTTPVEETEEYDPNAPVAPRNTYVASKPPATNITPAKVVQSTPPENFDPAGAITGGCVECGNKVPDNVAAFSKQHFGAVVCFEHQKLEKWQRVRH